jgi:aryl sulfotransferase
MAFPLPQVSRIYQNYVADSTRWERFIPRTDDIVIATSPKSGTTWMQFIVLNLIFQKRDLPPVHEVSPWLDQVVAPVDQVIAKLDAQQHRRFIKTHLPLDGLPFYPQIKYIVVGRDPRDASMSFWNHYSNFTEEAYAKFNGNPSRVGDSLPRCPQDIHEYWHNWITRGAFDWTTEGYPTLPNMHHAQTWWDFRHLDNILFVHYNDMLSDLKGEIHRVAEFLNIALSDEEIADLARATSFSAMKQIADRVAPSAGMPWKGGAQTFMFKGTNGRWKEILSAEELALYNAAVARVLTPDCALWLEQGRKMLR